MLLVHQTGSVKVGEVVRYTVTYEPDADRVIPSPSNLHVRVKNTSAIPLRAAYLNGPYALHVAAYPITFDPNSKFHNPKRNGLPQFETNLKAGSSFNARLTVPEDMRVTSLTADHPKKEDKKKVTWVVEVASQVLFSNSAHVKFEILIGRDERSLEFNFAAIPSTRHVESGQIQDNQTPKKRRNSNSAHPKGVYSKAITLVVDDTDSLWNRPALPVWEQSDDAVGRKSTDHRGQNHPPMRPRGKKKKIHLVILTHGLHSNLGADMLYMKESIDATVKAARESASKRRKEARSGKATSTSKESGASEAAAQKDIQEPSTAPLSGGQQDITEEHDDIDDSDDEQVIVRGFSGNATKTENGIQYLGKRLARYILDITFPDQPVRFLKKKTITQKLSNSIQLKKNGEQDKNKTGDEDKHAEGLPSHDRSKIRQEHVSTEDLAYTFTSISFIGHSLGGLIQIYAMAYIQKHAPSFFDKIKPINFVGMAAPMLGLSNENPMYVRFALDFGLVGRTGQDLGLSWRAPTLARSGWTAMVGGLGGNNEHDHEDPRAKPLLRVLPTGPAHVILRKFRNRSLYSNIVNDGVVPLRTSSLLFLDWRGLDKVEKARRDNGLVGTMLGWGWAELTGQNAVGEPILDHPAVDDEITEDNDETQRQTSVPQPSENAANEDETASIRSLRTTSTTSPGRKRPKMLSRASTKEEMGPFETIWSYLRPSGKTTKTDLKMFKRSQTLSPSPSMQNLSGSARSQDDNSSTSKQSTNRPAATRGDSSEESRNQNAPPKTTIFESAADLLSPPTPPMQWILDPSARSRTIFHDRVYHPEDIPPPPSPQKRVGSSASLDSRRTGASNEPIVAGGMRVEEKIARAYHRDLSWRKVLVRLEPDAHNNMIVRRMFANAYGWPVVKHVCDTHFGDSYSAMTRDEDEPAHERAKAFNVPVGQEGERVHGQESIASPDRPEEMLRQTTNELAPLKNDSPKDIVQRINRADSVEADESYLEDSGDEEHHHDQAQRGAFQRLWSPAPPSPSSASSKAHGNTAKVGLHQSPQNTLTSPIATPSSSAPVREEINRSLSITEQIVQSAKSTQENMEDGRS